MRGSRIFPRMISGLAVAACVAVLVSVGHAQIIGPVVLTKTFTGGPVRPGDSVTLEFTIENSDPTSVAADIGFTDNLDAVVPGLVATGLPPTPVCGPGSQISGTSTLTFSGGSVAAGASCTFSVTLLVPAGAAAGSHLNTTSPLTTELEGRPFVGTPATGTLAVLAIGPVVLTKTFTGGPVLPGNSATLEFTIQNLDTNGFAAADIGFTDDLDAVVSGLVAAGLPATHVCGPGSEISGTSTLTFSGGSVAAGASCTFSVTLLVPAGAAAGSHLNTTSPLTTELEGRPFVGPPATGTLAVLVVGPVGLTKTFTGGPVLPGNSVTLEFTIQNLDTNGFAAADIGFTDDLDAVVSGLVAAGLPATDVCGPGSEISGTSTLTFSGGSVAAGASCTFSVTLLVPAGAAAGSHLNTTSPLTTELDGTPFVGAPATDTLEVLSVPVPVAVPTLEWWGLLLLFGLLGLAAWWGLQRGHTPPPASA